MKTPDNAPDIKVGHKTPDEIKKGLECCYGNEERRFCEMCPFGVKTDGIYPAFICSNFDAVGEGALALIQQLEAERDAAVKDMKQAAIYLCCACENYHHAVRGVSHHYCEVFGKRDDFTGAISCGMFKWRGVQKEESDA